MSAQRNYEAAYDHTVLNLPAIKALVADKAGHVVRITTKVGGRDSVKGMFDALIDRGCRAELVQALNSPALDFETRDLLETLLYGSGCRSRPALLFKQLH